MKSRLEQFKEEVCDNPNAEELKDVDWYAPSIGFFLAKGASIEVAVDLALKARYDHHYWNLTF